MATIALIGGTGLVGSAVLKELVARGHDVKAIVRSKGKIQAAGTVSAVVADVYDTAALIEALRGSEAVVSAFNPGWDNPKIYDDFLAGSRSIRDAAKRAGVGRLLVVGGAGSLFIDGKQLVDGPGFPEAFKPGALAARDFLDELRAETQLDWVFLSPPIEFGAGGPTERTGRYRVGGDSPLFNAEGRSTISPADLAIAIVDEVEKPKHHRARFTVGQ